jgi:hypothetical protein
MCSAVALPPFWRKEYKVRYFHSLFYLLSFSLQATYGILDEVVIACGQNQCMFAVVDFLDYRGTRGKGREVYEAQHLHVFSPDIVMMAVCTHDIPVPI